jgi:hypothetical protein
VKIIKGTSKGFFANLLDAARHISQSLKADDPWFVDWDNTPYNDKSYGSNAWEYYFVNPTEITDRTQICSDYTHLELLGERNFRETMNFILVEHLQFNSKIKSIIDSIANKNYIGVKTLGVHIRKTDKHNWRSFGEPESAIPLDLNFYKKYIDRYIENYENVYIATDDANELAYLKQYIGDVYNKEVVYLEAFRSSSNISIHGNYPNISGYKKGLEVLIDCVNLSKCGFLIRSSSNVSSTAQFFNLALQHVNINEVELGDNREEEFNLKSIT